MPDRPLTPRQHLILRSVARGATNKEIARELGISEQGVKVHISRLLDRYGATNRVELVALTRAWADADERAYAAVSSTVQAREAMLASGEAMLSPSAPADVRTALTELRDLLTEVNVAAKLARELPADSATGPLIDAIQARAHVALERSAKLATMIEERSHEHAEGTREVRRAN